MCREALPWMVVKLWEFDGKQVDGHRFFWVCVLFLAGGWWQNVLIYIYIYIYIVPCPQI